MAGIRTVALGGLVLVGCLLTACDAVNVGTLISSTNPTATPSKTARPTFTPPPTVTPTESATLTPAPTDTPSASATPTKKPAATTAARPAATKAPTGRPPTAAPSYSVSLNKTYFCDQSNDPLWEVIGRINRSSPPAVFLGGYGLAIVSADGRVLGVREAVPDGQQVSDYDFNCAVKGWYQYNVKYDVSEFRMSFPVIVRIVRSKSDLTPVSPDYRLDFSKPGRYFVEYGAAQ